MKRSLLATGPGVTIDLREVAQPSKYVASSSTQRRETQLHSAKQVPSTTRRFCAAVRSTADFCSRYGLTWRQLYNRCTPATAFLEALPCADEATPPHFLALTCRDRALASVLALTYQPSHQQLGEDHVKTCTPPRLIKGKHPETYKTPGERFRASISTTIWS